MRKIGKDNKVPASKPRQKNKKKVAVAYGIGILILIYFVYAIIQLIMKPTDVIAIANGNLSEEESAVRLCHPRRDGHTGRQL